MNDVVWRGVVKTSGNRNVYNPETRLTEVVPGPHLLYSRPYNTKAPAKAAVTKMRKNHPNTFIEGWVEYSVEWKVLDED